MEKTGRRCAVVAIVGDGGDGLLGIENFATRRWVGVWLRLLEAHPLNEVFLG
jgi:hypothetical protein